jgi:hypothetical protein
MITAITDVLISMQSLMGQMGVSQYSFKCYCISLYWLMFITIEWPDTKFYSQESLCKSFRTVVRTEFLETTINNRQTGE